MASKPLFLSLHTGELTEDMYAYLNLISKYLHFYTRDAPILNQVELWNVRPYVTSNDILIVNASKYETITETFTRRNGTTHINKYKEYTPFCANQLYQILTDHPEIVQIHTFAKQTIAIVHYWVLWDVCDKSLTHKDLSLNISKTQVSKTEPIEPTEPSELNAWDYPEVASDEESDETGKLFENDKRKVADCTLTDEQIQTVRQYLQSIPNLHVMCNNVWPLNWNINTKAAHVAILKTFPNITDFNYTWNDKNWKMYPMLSWDLWKRWGIRSHNVVRYHGSDDCCYEGDCSAEARFIQVSQHGHEETTETVWRKWHNPAFQHTLQFMRLKGEELELTDAFLADMSYLQGLVKVTEEDDIQFFIRLSGFNTENEKTLTLPPMPNLVSLSIGFFPKEDPATPLDPAQTYTFYLDVLDSPNMIEYPSMYNHPANIIFKVRNKTPGLGPTI